MVYVDSDFVVVLGAYMALDVDFVKYLYILEELIINLQCQTNRKTLT